MQYTQFRVQNRINEYLQRLKSGKAPNIRFIINALAWWISFFITILLFEIYYGIGAFALVVHFYFWFSLNKDLINKFVPPVEILLAAIFVFAIIDFSILNSSDALQTGQNFNVFSGWSFGGIVHKLFLSFIILFFGLLLVENNERKQGILVLYTAFLIIGHYGFFYGHVSYLFIFQIILFFSLMKRTIWLETLTRLELIIYFALILWFFLIITEPSFVKIIQLAADENQTITYSLPYFLYLLIKLYWLALLVRIPIVVIYNHASLSRKLRIAGLFQSSFPLFIQLTILLIIFFLFIAGWQADQLRDRFNQAKKQVESTYQLYMTANGSNKVIKIPGYQSLQLGTDISSSGVITLKRSSVEISDRIIDFFFFDKELKNDKEIFKLTKLDESFLTKTSANLKVLAGNGLVAYTHKPRRWLRYFSDIEFFESSNQINTNPFALIYPLAGEAGYGVDRIISPFPGDKSGFKNWSWNLHLINLKNPLIIVGRLSIPLIHTENPEHTKFLIDIFFDLRSLFQWNFMTQILLVLIILFFIFNMLIIKRVVAFGSQITASVIQKFDVLKKGIREVSSGNLDYKVEMEGEDEFVELAGRFNQMGIRLQETIEEAREKDRLDQELNIARQVQLSLLKKNLPEIEGYHVAANLQTATEVGGDFYDLIPIDEKRYIFSVGDVSGKGSSAAFYMAQFISLLRYTPKFVDDPKEVAIRLNEYIMNQISDRQIFITAIIGILNTQNDEVQLVRAGHNLPLLISSSNKKAIKEINPSGLGIGLSKSDDLFTKSLKPYKFKLKKGEKLLLFTDGIVEARRPTSSSEGEEAYEIYGEERFINLLTEFKLSPADGLTAIITDDLDTFYGEHPRIDDFTMMIIEKDPA